jgi:hypothetical protein
MKHVECERERAGVKEMASRPCPTHYTVLSFLAAHLFTVGEEEEEESTSFV